MASFHYRGETARRIRMLTSQATVVLFFFLIIATALIVRGHQTFGLSLLIITALFGALDILRMMRLRKSTGSWEIAIDDEFFRWSSPHQSLGPTFEIPIKAIKTLVVTNYAWSEVGSGKRYYLILEDGTQEQLWGWDSVPMDRIKACLKSNGISLVHENA